MTASSSSAEPAPRFVHETGLAVCALFVVSMALKEALPLLGLHPSAPAYSVALPTWAGAVLMVAVWPPIEEAGRFWLVSKLRDRLGFWVAALLANSIWTALHLPTSAFTTVIVFAAGAIISVLLWRTGSLLACTIAHVAYNSVPAALTVLYLT